MARISSWFGRGEKFMGRIIEGAVSCSSVWESHYVGNHELRLVLAPAFISDSGTVCLFSLVWS